MKNRLTLLTAIAVEICGKDYETEDQDELYLSSDRRTPLNAHLSLLEKSTYDFTVASGIFHLKTVKSH